MKLQLCLLAAALVSAGAMPAAASVMVDVTFTGDNVIAGYVQQEGENAEEFPLGSSNLSDWKQADTVTLNLEPSQAYQIVFRVENSGSANSGNPAALLAQITGGVLGGPIYSSSDWEYAEDDGDPVTNFDDLTWESAIATAGGPSYSDASNGGDNIWTNVNSSAAISGISSSADWIWDDTTGSDTTSSLYLRTSINTVPEPGSLLVWAFVGLSAVGGVFWRRRRAVK